MHTLLDDYITGMGFVGIEPGRLYRLAPVTQGVETVLSGTGSVVLENVVSDWVELSLCGRSEQTTTTGAQLFDAETIFASQIQSGLIFVNEDGGVTLNGNFNAANRNFSITLRPGTYYLSGECDSENNLILHKLFPVDTGFNGLVTIEEETTIDCYISSGEYENTIIYPMINTGSSALPWESYTGGAPSPSPDYPQKIENCGKYGNLLENIYGAKNGETVTGGKGDILTNDYTDSTFVELPAHGHERVMQWVSSHTRGYTLYIRLFDKNKDLVHSSNANIFSATGQQGIHYVINVPQEAMYYCIIGENNQCTVNDIMLNIGSTALPWEPYGYKIETTLDNAGYIERGSASENVKKIALKKGQKYKLYSEHAGNNKNTFVFTDGDLDFSASGILYNYGFSTMGLKNVNSTGIVSEPCRLNPSWNPSVEFEVVEDGLYLYYAVNAPDGNTDDIWVWTGEGYLTDTPYQSQTITSYLTDGLPGIPVPSGGNYTDEDGQQWITDEIDYKRGKLVQRVKERIYGENENVNVTGYNAIYTIKVSDANYNAPVLSNMFSYNAKVADGSDFVSVSTYSNSIIFGLSWIPGKDKEAAKAWFAQKYAEGNPVKVLYALATPIETDLTQEEIEVYKALLTYKPTTIITADGGEVAPGITATYKKGE